jgi:hypothetical protein
MHGIANRVIHKYLLCIFIIHNRPRIKNFSLMNPIKPEIPYSSRLSGQPRLTLLKSKESVEIAD